MCTTCVEEFYSDEGVCLECGDHCLECKNSTTCVLCEENTDLIEGDCKCGDHCKGCTEDFSCAECEDTFVAKDNICQCETSAVYDEESGTCIEPVDSSENLGKEESNDELLETLESETGGNTGVVLTIGFLSSTLVLFLSLSNASALWLFINQAQILFYIPIQSTKYHDFIVNFWLSFGFSFYEILNLGEAVRGEMEENEDIPIEWRKDHYENADLLINTWEIELFLVIGLVFLPILLLCYRIFYKCPRIAKWFFSRIQDYRICFFIRFWIEAYIDILAASLIASGTVIHM